MIEDIASRIIYEGMKRCEATRVLCDIKNTIKGVRKILQDCCETSNAIWFGVLDN